MTHSLEAEPEEHKTSVVIGPAWAHVAVVILVAMALTYPCIRRGLPFGHSTVTHIHYQHFFNERLPRETGIRDG